MLWMMLVAVGWAGNPCKELKPKHKINPATVALARGALQTALSYGGVPLASSALATIPQPQSFGAIAGNEDAKAQTLYEICTMKEAGLLSATKAEELTVAALTGSVTTQTVAPTKTAEGKRIKEALDTAAQIQAAGRADIVEAMNLYCATAGMEAACDMYRESLAIYDKNIAKLK